ncbi:hypothetical protein ACSYDW_09710 [Paeniglutamicibacter sp. R2-26]|uniref:hypothetical protein n=1 Tax=Paeniglutamicibacter sp. R2-26 TaxID=3144417 RepID=UPI003EE512E0
MAPQTETSGLQFVERPPWWLRNGGAALLMVIAVVVAVEAVIESIWGFHVVAAALVVAAIWLWRLVKISVSVDDQTVTLTGPAWKRIVQRQDVHDVSVEADNGMNPGILNWPVITHERGSLTRLNVGGSAAVTFSDSSGHRYQFVFSNRQDADMAARTLTG